MASTQTTILPTARTTLSMAAHGALPRTLAEIHPRFLTPTWSTWGIGLASVAWYVVLVLIDSSENILWDSISGLGFAIAFYYGITALASPILFRRVLTKSWKHFLLVGVAPVLAALTLLWVFVRSAIDYWDPENSYTPAWFAFGGLPRRRGGVRDRDRDAADRGPADALVEAGSPEFFRRKAEVAGSIDEELPDPDRVLEEATGLEPLTVVPPTVRESAKR